jgi:phage minor structural protein
LYTIDNTKKPQKISMFLAKPDRTIIGKLNVFQNAAQTIRFGQINELSFTVPYETMINSKLVRNKIVDLIREKFLIKVVFGNQEEWYRINKKTKSMNDSDSISVECFSLAYDLKFQKMIDYKVDSYNCLQVMEDCLKDTSWTVGYINPEFNTTWRQFDVSSSTKLDFINQICETFKGTPIYDTVNRKVGIYKDSELSTYKGFWISYGKYLSTIEDTVSIEDIVTRLVVTSNDSVSINSANPTGQNYIDDFSYFLYPFERDENKNVILSSYFMSDKLCHAILDYNELINSNSENFFNLLQTKKSLEMQMTTLNNDLQTLNDELKVILDNIQIQQQTNNSTINLVAQRDSKQKEIDAKQKDINNLQKSIDSNATEITNLNQLLQFDNYFTGDLLSEIREYIQVEEWSDDSQINDEDYFYAASDYLKTKSIPAVNLSLNIVNFFEIVEEQHNWNKMSIGDIIRVKHPKLGIDVKTTISEITFNYDEGTIQLTISNTKRPESVIQKFQNAMYKINKLNTDYNKRKINWNAIATNFENRNDRISVKPTNPQSSTISHKENDNGSIDLTVSWNYPDYITTKSDADNIDGFILYLHSNSTSDEYVFGSNIAKETYIPISSEKRTYTFASVPSNLYYSMAIKSYRHVDDDINSDGVLFSDLILYSQYLPSPFVTIKGDLNGKVNGVLYSVSDIAPENPSINDKWFDTTIKQDKVFNGTDWEVAAAGDASTLNGKTSNDFAPSTVVGSLPSLKTSEKTTLVGAINEQSDQLGDKASRVVSITYNGATTKFYNQTTTLYVDVDIKVTNGNDGLSASKPIKLSDIQTIFNSLKAAFPKLLGTWTVVLTGTTYQSSGTSNMLYLSDVDSDNYIVFKGADVTLGDVPTTIIDGKLNGTPYMHGFYFQNMNVLVQNIKFQNFSESTNANVETGTRGGLVFSGERGKVYTINVHGSVCSWGGIVNQGVPKMYVKSGTFDNCRYGICSMFNTTVTIGYGFDTVKNNVAEKTTITNNWQAGVYLASQANGHVDYCAFSDNKSRALQLETQSEVNCVSSTFNNDYIAMASNASRILNTNCIFTSGALTQYFYERTNFGIIDDTTNDVRGVGIMPENGTNFVNNAPAAGGTFFTKVIPKLNVYGRGKMVEVEMFGRLVNPTGNTSTITISASDGTNNPTLITVNVPTTSGAYGQFYFKFYLTYFSVNNFYLNGLTEVIGYVNRAVTNTNGIVLDATKDITLTFATTFTGAGQSSLSTYKTIIKNVY